MGGTSREWVADLAVFVASQSILPLSAVAALGLLAWAARLVLSPGR